MPFSSDQIAQMNAQYQGAMMQQQQQASMIGSNMPLADSIVGGGMNRAAAIGGPMASLGLGLAGLDPISMGLRGGMAGARFGMAGAIGGGLAGAGVAMGGAMAVGYGVNQMFSGAQQQQGFNNTMNSTFRFANQYGGQGFNRGELGNIGGMMRNMSTEQGPQGQMVGFEELGRLASNMGRMGMAQGVRDAKEFGDKFREMVKTVKQIAESMGTSLEEAQKMMGAMRSSGVFGQNQAASFASRVRTGAVAGGMATSELTGMMSVGSQISRMVGGRGRAGAAGGLETITNIGVAQQMGLISEEDIYNTTGLTGAEGRRAMATRQMEQSAQFLKGSLGRRFLASIAGKNGQLDEASANEYAAGGVGTDRTTSMYQRNLAKIGRADFIRNEGKLRGAALERFGGLAPMMAMKGWLEDRGQSVDENNDRTMIFMQRQLGMGNDEAEMMLKQIRSLPQLLNQRRNAGEDDDYMRRIQERKSHTGLEGIQHKFEKAKAEVDKVLQQVGADFYTSMSDSVDGFINRLTDTYVKETRADVAGAFRTMMGGGAMGAEAGSSTFGVGKSFKSSMMFGSLIKSGRSTMDTFNEGDSERYSKAGFGYSGGEGGLMAHMNKVSGVVAAMKGGGAGLDGLAGVQSQGKAGSDALRKALMGDMGTSKGMDRLDQFGKFLQGQSGAGNLGADELAVRFASAGALEKAQIMAAYSSKEGAGVDQSGAFSDPGMRGVYGTSNMRSIGEGATAVGGAFGFKGRRSMLGGASRGDEEVGKFLLSEGGRDLMTKMLSDNEGVRATAKDSVEKEIISLNGKDDRSKAEDARLRGLRGMLLSQKLTEMEVNGATPEQLDAEAERLGKEQGLSLQEVKSQVSTINALAERNRLGAQTEAGERFGARARASITGLRGSGLVTGEGDNLTLNSAAADKLGGGSAGKAFLEAMVEKQKTMAKMGPGADNEALLGQANAAGSRMLQNLAGMSVSEQRRLAGGLSTVDGAEEEAGVAGLVASTSGTLESGGKRKQGLATAAGMLGANISQEELTRLVKDGGLGAAAKAIAGRIGDGSLSKNKNFLKDLEGSLGSVQEGKFGAAGASMSGLLGNETVSKARVQAATDSDPNTHLKGIKGDTEQMAKAMGSMVTSLGEISASTKKSAEDWL